jgi:hypothetical protein
MLELEAALETDSDRAEGAPFTPRGAVLHETIFFGEASIDLGAGVRTETQPEHLVRSGLELPEELDATHPVSVGIGHGFEDIVAVADCGGKPGGKRSRRRVRSQEEYPESRKEKHVHPSTGIFQRGGSSRRSASS